MNKVYEYMETVYGYNEPIFTDELQKTLIIKFDLKEGTIRQTIKRLADNGQLSKVQQGIYFIPNPDSLLKKQMLSVEKIVEKKFINNECEVFGYKSGINFANYLGLTSQTASVPTIITNNTCSYKRTVKYYNKTVIVKKPKVKVTECNYKLLQVLDLLNEYERISEEPLNSAYCRIFEYLKDVYLPESELRKTVDEYPDKAKSIFYESGVYNELTHG
ncbi:DUF6088 family protein [Lysinibacillus xylanilyticus]|uniref:DUF6088 family protein n=1 Tax=Lysinibacillus xylanilyticus TaxID=582475 RepID=UPI0038191437